MADQPILPQVGDRVRLRLEAAENWLMPERKFAKEGRLATVTAVPNLKFSVTEYRIRFDVKRKNAKAVTSWVALRDLEVVRNV